MPFLKAEGVLLLRKVRKHFVERSSRALYLPELNVGGIQTVRIVFEVHQNFVQILYSLPVYKLLQRVTVTMDMILSRFFYRTLLWSRRLRA